MKTYCYNCGAKSEFSIRDKPKFCSKCGVSFSGESKEKERVGLDSVEAEEDEGIVNIPNISELEYDFYDMKKSKETIGSLVGTGTSSGPPGSNKPQKNMPSMTREQAMEIFQKEAGSIKRSAKKKDAET
jgi:hypothetical protein